MYLDLNWQIGGKIWYRLPSGSLLPFRLHAQSCTQHLSCPPRLPGPEYCPAMSLGVARVPLRQRCSSWARESCWETLLSTHAVSCALHTRLCLQAHLRWGADYPDTHLGKEAECFPPGSAFSQILQFLLESSDDSTDCRRSSTIKTDTVLLCLILCSC